MLMLNYFHLYNAAKLTIFFSAASAIIVFRLFRIAGDSGTGWVILFPLASAPFMFFHTKRKAQTPYMLLLVVILAVILVIIGFALLRNVFLPLIMSAVWGLILKLVKDGVRNIFFPSEG